MSHSDLIDSVSKNEGYRERPYHDTQGLLTFGKGRCLETNPLSPAEWKHLLENNMLSVSISLEGANWLMLRGIDEAEKLCMRFDFWPLLDEVRREALIEMAYQLGPRLLGFKKMLAAISRQDWSSTYTEALDSRWHNEQTPKRAKILAAQLSTGVRA